MHHVRLATLLLALLIFVGACAKSPPLALPDLAKGGTENLSKVETALKKGQDVNAKNPQGYTALLVAAERGLTSIVKALLQKGADVHEKEPRQGRTALVLATANGHADTVQALLEKGADPNEKDMKGLTALMLAVDKGSLPIVQALLSKGADVQEKDLQGKTALMIAAKKATRPSSRNSCSRAPKRTRRNPSRAGQR